MDKKRVETGVVQFENDWCGIFLRGDSAFNYALQLQSLLNNPNDIIAKAILKEFVFLLFSCQEPVIPEEKIQKAKLIE